MLEGGDPGRVIGPVKPMDEMPCSDTCQIIFYGAGRIGARKGREER